MRGTLLFISLIIIGFGGHMTVQSQPYFACSSKYLFAFDEDGDLKWKASVKHRGTVEKVRNDMVILRSSLKERSGIEYAAYDPTNGDLIWKTAIPYHDSIYVGYNETLYVISTDLGDYLLNLKTGELLIGEPPEGWESHGYFKSGPPREIKTPTDTSKIAGHKEEIIVGWSSKFIFGFDPEGNVKWKIKRPKGFSGYCESHNLYALRAGKELITLEGLTGKIRWKKSLPAKIQSCSISYPELTIYLVDGEKLIFNIETGELLKEKGLEMKG